MQTMGIIQDRRHQACNLLVSGISFWAENVILKEPQFNTFFRTWSCSGTQITIDSTQKNTLWMILDLFFLAKFPVILENTPGLFRFCLGSGKTSFGTNSVPQEYIPYWHVLSNSIVGKWVASHSEALFFSYELNIDNSSMANGVVTGKLP